MKVHAHGKLILFGEHAVVYGEPAIVTQINRGVSVSIVETGETDNFLEHIQAIFSKQTGISIDHSQTFFIQSELPLGSGLGSSAAVAYACFQALAAKYKVELTEKEYLDLVGESEIYMHGNPSGIDTYGVVKGGILSFQKTENEPRIEKIKTTIQQQAILIHSGKPVETTKDMVSHVATLLENDSSLKDVITEIGLVSQTVIDDLKQNTFNLAMIQKNQRLLETLDIMSKEGLAVIHKVENLGGVAKVTGAGGRTNGSGTILVLHEDAKALQQIQEYFGDSAYTITFPIG